MKGVRRKQDGDWGGATAATRGKMRGGGQKDKDMDEAEAGVVMVAVVVVAMVVLLGVEPGASREEFEEWSNPGLRKQMRETGEEGAEGAHSTEEGGVAAIGGRARAVHGIGICNQARPAEGWETGL